jgi:hypothetical protein
LLRFGLLAVLTCGPALLPWRASSARPSERDEPTPRAEAQRATLEQLAGSILERVDSEQRGKGELGAQEKAGEQAGVALARAKASRDEAKNALKRYEGTTFPREEKAALDEIATAEAELARAKAGFERSEQAAKRGVELPYQRASARLRHEEVEFRLEKARTTLAVLRKHTKPKMIADLKAAIEKAESDVQEEVEQLSSQKQKEADLRRRLEEEALSEDEARAIVRLDEAIRLMEQGDPDGAKAKLDEAATFWKRGESRRSEFRYAATKRRLGRAAEDVRRRGLAR